MSRQYYYKEAPQMLIRTVEKYFNPLKIKQTATTQRTFKTGFV